MSPSQFKRAYEFTRTQLIACTAVALFGICIVGVSCTLGGNSADSCFCQLKGQIDDCSCNVDTVDFFNNAKIYPRLKSLLVTDYFRYFKVNLGRKCPFWADDSGCVLRDCSVQHCTEDELPIGLKGSHQPHANKYSAEANQEDNCVEDELGALNSTISMETFEEFEKWRAYDDSKSAFCEIDDDLSNETQYVDLLLNPERYTGYKGISAHRIWHSIYKENCFQPEKNYEPFMTSKFINEMCLEKRAFYRAISGLHSSINIHLCVNYLISGKNSFSKPAWGLNLQEFQSRFDPETSNGEGPLRLKNLYFVYLLELRALAKAAPYLQSFRYYTGNGNVDKDVRAAVGELLQVIKTFPNHFDESVMFAGNNKEVNKLKEEFRLHFLNISKIMDCVGCDKCRLWGKVQTQGLGTAMKILFTKDEKAFADVSGQKSPNKPGILLKRSEVVSLFNAFGRLSTSINELEKIRMSHKHR